MNHGKIDHPLTDTTVPNLLENTFDYNLPPLIKFDGPIVRNRRGYKQH